MKRKILFLVMLVSFVLPFFAQTAEEGKSALAMLNYVTYLSYDIKVQKNNRLYLEEIYDQIGNNVLEDKIDEGTQHALTKMRDRIIKFRMLEIQRDRIEFLNENKQSQAIRSAIPNPLFLLSVVQSKNPIEVAMTLASTAISSVSSYSSAKNEANIEYLKNGWELDDKEQGELHELSNAAFEYKTTFIRDNNIKAIDTLNEVMLGEFAEANANTNLASKIAFFEKSESKKNYKHFGLYYLALAKAYYENEQYKECLTAIENYEKNNVQIFRKDYEYAKVLPLVIVAAQKVYPKNYEIYINKYLFDLNSEDDIDLTVKGNSNETDWALRYFVAQTCIQLYAKTNEIKYLNEAYTLSFDGTRKYTEIQKKLIEEYFMPINIPETATKSEKDVIKQLQKERETELLPISEPFILNCDMLFALVDKLNKPQSEKDRIYNIVSDVFVYPQLKSTYISNSENTSKSLDSLLSTLIKETHSKIDTHSVEFNTIFMEEYKSKYKEALLNEFPIKNDEEISLLADKARTTDTVIASWNSNNTFMLPAKFLSDKSEISVTINQLVPNSDAVVMNEFKNVSFKVDKIKKGVNRSIEDFTCYISFIDNSLCKFKYDSKSKYSVIVDIKLGSSEVSFVFFSNKTLMGLEFKQLSDNLLTNIVEQSAFSFPEIQKKENKGNIEFSKEIDELLIKYILGSVKKLEDNSDAFKQAFIKEYKMAYYEEIKNVLGVSTEKELLNVLRMAKDSSEIFASIEGTKITLPANLIYSNTIIGLDLIEDDVKVCSKNNISYKKSNKISEIEIDDRKEEISEVEIDFEELAKYKFNSGKKYRINLYILSNDKNYSIVFVRNEYSSFIVLKTQKFVTLSQYLKEILTKSMDKNSVK